MKTVSVLTLATILAAVFPACGDSAPATAGTKPDSSPQDALVSWKRLDRKIAPRDLKEGALAGQVFWRRLREFAIQLDDQVLVSDRLLTDPENLPVKPFAQATSKARGLPEAWRSGVTMRTVPLGKWKGRRSRLAYFGGGPQSMHLRNMVAHPASPPARIRGFALASFSRVVAGEERDRKVAAFLDHLPSFEQVAKAAEAGAVAFVCLSRRGETIQENQFPLLRDLEGRNGRDLPIPLIILPQCNDLHVDASLNAAGPGEWRLTVERSSTKKPAALLAVRLPAPADAPRVIITHSRRETPLWTGRGSQSLPVAVLVEAARALSAFDATNPDQRLAVSVEFVHVADGGVGYDWLSSLAKSEEHRPLLLGVIDLEDVAPEDTGYQAALLRYDGSGRTSALGRALRQVLADYVGRPEAWLEAGMSNDGSRVPAAVAEQWGQERIPVVEVATCAPASRASLVPPPVYEPLPSALTTAPPRSKSLGGGLDEVRALTDEHMTPQVALARLIVLGVRRLSQSWKR